MKPDVRSWLRRARPASVLPRGRLPFVRPVLSGDVWPRAAYRFGWGPSARPVLQGVFAAACELTARRPDLRQLQDAGILSRESDAVVTDAPVAELERLMDRTHSLGIAGLWRSYRALARGADGALRFRDLATARVYGSRSIAFAAARDTDRRKFNLEFGATLLTAAGARRLLEELRARAPDVAAGLDLRLAGSRAPTAAATGSQDALERPVIAPLVAGKRVLDLASRPMSFLLLLLGAGAGEVVAITDSPEAADIARTGAQLMAWRDIRPYSLQIVPGGLRSLMTGDLGTFDVVTACASLTRLPEDESARTLHTAARLGAVLIVQAGEEGAAESPGTATLYRLLRESGCADITVSAPEGLSRPLLVGYTYASPRRAVR